MKKINMAALAGQAPVEVKEEVVSAGQAFVEQAKTETPLPPMPAHIGKPVGNPPPDDIMHRATFEEFFELAKLTGSKSDPIPMQKAMIWAQMSQALATKQLADGVDDLLVFLGARDEPGEDPVDDGPRFSHQITDSLVDVAVMANDELLPPGTIDIVKAALAQRISEVLKP